ncbi:MAG: hypothetical protein P8M53_06170 [Pirellulales bacterium]|nr:hypothetical protein [Pirellulales bacterium]
MGSKFREYWHLTIAVTLLVPNIHDAGFPVDVHPPKLQRLTRVPQPPKAIQRYQCSPVTTTAAINDFFCSWPINEELSLRIALYATANVSEGIASD